jgi:hypothetical protein
MGSCRHVCSAADQVAVALEPASKVVSVVAMRREGTFPVCSRLEARP